MRAVLERRVRALSLLSSSLADLVRLHRYIPNQLLHPPPHLLLPLLDSPSNNLRTSLPHPLFLANPSQLINSSTPVSPHSYLPPLSVLPVETKLHRALGPAFTYAADISLWLTKADEVWTREQEGIGIIELVRNRRGVASGVVGFVSVSPVLGSERGTS